jgi:ankyrin repeat protein
MEHSQILFGFITKNKWPEFIDYLKNNDDIDVNIRDNNGNYLISYAIIMNNLDALSLLIHRNSKLDMIDQDGRSILFLPIKMGFNDVLKLLLHFNNTTIGISLVDMMDIHGNIPLHYAIMFKNMEAIKYLLEYKSNVNHTDKNRYNALHFAIHTKREDICELILNTDININERIDTGENALHMACNFQLLDIVTMLIDAKIEVNAQDIDHEFTPLHYSINNNNAEITGYLLKNGANPNMQDYVGNTALHYTIMEDNLELFVILINSIYTESIINFNIYNFESKLPIHLILEKSSDYFLEHIDKMIVGSNLNFQNVDGYTPLHYLSMSGLWKQHIDNLTKKKLNVFIPNAVDKKPIDYIKPDDMDTYLDMIANSYIYVLRNYATKWRDNWENMCTKELHLNKLSKTELAELKKMTNNTQFKNDDICKDIVLNKLKIQHSSKADNRKAPICNYASYPIKENKQCIVISEGENVELCTIIGSTLDSLVGVIYLLNKHKHACATIDTQFMENKELTAYYKSIGLTTSYQDFLNFEVVWVNKKLFFNTNFVENFEKCGKNKDKRFIIIPLGIEVHNDDHANYLIYDKKKNEIERFETYGGQVPFNFDYNASLLDKLLEKKFKEFNPNIIYIAPDKYMPKMGFQFFDTFERKTKKIGDPHGFCAMWAIWYTDLRLTYYDIDRRSLVNKMLKSVKMQQLSFKNIIRNYSANIMKIRDEVFKKVGLTINDYMNDQYTDKQYSLMIYEVSTMIRNATT